jgi:LemA protein
MSPLMILAIVIALLLAIFAVMYNRLVSMRQRTQNAWSDVDVYLKRRADLIPQLVEAVKGYSHYEQSTLQNLVSARSQALAAGAAPPQRAIAEGAIALGLQHAIGLAEAYPDLKASDQFLSLQNELKDAERLIADARQYYNACVRDYNTLTESFPSAIAAGMFGMRQKDFFEPENPADREVPSASVQP